MKTKPTGATLFGFEPIINQSVPINLMLKYPHCLYNNSGKIDPLEIKLPRIRFPLGARSGQVYISGFNYLKVSGTGLIWVSDGEVSEGKT